ncbi:MAG: FG-GAP repeat protein, partial [Verrucomicrobiales bacterium]|nr:FG-GAP repeat protein [Verrucomicrobiales bacterium]
MNRLCPSRPSLSHPLPSRRRLAAALLPLLALILAATPPARAQGTLPPGVLKLHSRGTGDKGDDQFGLSVAVSDTWMVVGEPQNDDFGADAGAAYVYASTTGRFVRRLTPVPALPSSAFFGWSVAISGPLALIGAIGEQSARGAGYVFDLRTGRQVARLTAADGLESARLGDSVALNGDLALIGASSLFENRLGAAYLFHARTGTQLGKLTASNGAAHDLFGLSVALSGSLALVGARDLRAAYTYDVSGAFQPAPVFPELAILTPDDGAPFDFFGTAVSLSGHRALIGASGKNQFRGGAYLFDARTTTSTPLQKFDLADAAPFTNFGSAVSLNGNLAVIGASGRSTAYLYDSSTGREIARLTPPDATGNGLGTSLAVSGNRVLVGALFDDDLADDAGAAYLYRPVSVPLPLTAVAKVGDFAPGTVETNFTGFTAAYLNDESEVGLSAALSNRSRGVWSEYAGPLRPALRIGDDLSGPLGLAGVTAAGYGEIIPEDQDGLLVQTFLRGPGIGRANSLAWLRHTGSATNAILRQGGTFAELGGAPAFLSFPEVVQKSPNGQVLAAYTLARSATTGTTLANDSGVTYRDENGATVGGALSDTRHREGDAAPTGTVGDTYGQFFGRVSAATGSNYFAFSAYYVDTTPADPLPDVIRQGVFLDQLITDNPLAGVRQGLAPNGLPVTNPGDPAPTYRAFFGETLSRDGWTVFRTLVTGTEITRFNDEGIFSEQTQSPYLREGQPIDAANAPGLVIAGFLGYWPVDADNKIIALVKLRGPGVTKANDCAVVLAGRTNNYLQILLREGDLAGADDASRVAVIQRVDVDRVNGHYHILAALTGSPAR